jgi:hypothetical protein
MHETNFPNGIRLQNLKNNSGLLSIDNNGIIKVDTQGITGSIETLFSTYTNSMTTAAISAGLQSQINSINVVAGSNITVVQNPSKTWTISSTSSGNGFVPIAGTGMSISAQSISSYQFSVLDYISNTTVTALTGNIQSQLNNKQNNITLVGGVNVNIIESPANTWTINASISGGSGGQVSGIQGRYQLDNINSTFTITHPTIDFSQEFPVCSLEVASQDSELYIVGIHERSANSFKVTLSGVADSSTYILWHISSQSTGGTTDISAALIDYTLLSITSDISAGLNSRLLSVESINTSQANSINTLFSTYTNSTTTSAISAGLNSRLNSVENTNTSQTNSINTLFSTYTNSSTTSAISAGLNARILSVESINATNVNSINTLFSTYTNSTTTSAISAGLNSRLLSVESINTSQTNSINTLFGTYTNISTTSSISGGLNSRISALETSTSYRNQYSLVNTPTYIDSFNAGSSSKGFKYLINYKNLGNTIGGFTEISGVFINGVLATNEYGKVEIGNGQNITFIVDYSAPNVRLLANISSDTWIMAYDRIILST